jgi:predicted RNA polymerase sigma factor
MPSGNANSGTATRPSAAAAAELAARSSYSRLVAFLSARSRDVAAAEDALSDALQAALQNWPVEGVPEKPEAWLLTTARRRLIDQARHRQVHTELAATLEIIYENAFALADADMRFPDERLKLLFVCAHEALDPGARTPLMLQTVLGLDAARIAAAFLVSPAAMSQRLVRAKTKIRDANIRFEVPEREHLPARLPAVLDAIYAAYGTGWDNIAGSDPRQQDLAEEAIWLARVVVDLMPGEPEAIGLLALMLYCESRRGARRGANGEYVALSDQDASLWSHPMIAEAEQLLMDALALKRMGHYQIEAAIQSAHAFRVRTCHNNWEAIAALYDELVDISPSAGALIGRAAAMAEHRGVAHGLAALDEMDEAAIRSHQPYWAVRADLLARLKRPHEAFAAYTHAIGLTEDLAVRQYLLQKRNLTMT